VNAAAAQKTARDILGEGEHIATGVDGSMDFDERLQMMLFYSNATAYSCPFRVGEEVRFDLDAAFRESKLEATAAVPLWAEDMAMVASSEPELEIELEHTVLRIPNSFMTMGEIFLAWKAAIHSKILFLDRPISGTFSSLSRDSRNLLKMGNVGLLYWARNMRVTPLDIFLGVNIGSPSMVVPTRRRFLHLAMIKDLMSGPRSLTEIAKDIGVREEDVRKAATLIMALDSRFGNQLLTSSSPSNFELESKVQSYWDRVSILAESYADSVFSGKSHPLAIDRERYLSILDVNTVSLFLLLMLCERARERKAIVMGIAKDTTATDITRAVLPFAASTKRLTLASPPPALKNDRAFLAILSSENQGIANPWRTLGYDSSYSTIVKIGDEFVSARKYVSRERAFVRSFFQLRALKNDPGVRSQVFLFDRMFDESFDVASVQEFEVKERSGPTTVSAYLETGEVNPLSNMMLHILSLNDNPEVFEAFGHNQLLYLADKAVKAEVRLLRDSLRGLADLRVGGTSRRRKIFGLITSYRQQRTEAEHARMR
jgi:hypothetical protein